MADNSTIPVAVGNEVFANNDIGGVKYPRIKMTSGAAGVANDVSAANPLPISAPGIPIALGAGGGLKIDGSGTPLPVSGTVSVSGTVTVSGTVAATQSGVWNIGNLTSITNVVHIDDNSGSLTVDNTGVFAVQASQVGNWSVRIQDGAGNLLTSAIRGSQQALSVQLVDASGNQITSFGGTASAFGSAFPATGTAVGGSDGTNMVGFRIKAASTLPVATDPALVVAIRPDTQNANGLATMANSSPVVIASNQTAIPVNSTISGPLGQAAMAASVPVAIASDQSAIPVSGSVASGATDAGNPVKIGAQARITNPTAVTDGQRVNLIADKLGKQVVVGAIRDLKGVTETTITSSTAETTIVAAVASTFMDLYGLILSNSSATATKVTIKDSTGGTTRASLMVPAGETRGFMLPVDSAIPQSAVNNNWTATCGTSVASLDVTALWVKNI